MSDRRTHHLAAVHAWLAEIFPGASVREEPLPLDHVFYVTLEGRECRLLVGWERLEAAELGDLADVAPMLRGLHEGQQVVVGAHGPRIAMAPRAPGPCPQTAGVR